jgi:hypothetical protein
MTHWVSSIRESRPWKLVSDISVLWWLVSLVPGTFALVIGYLQKTPLEKIVVYFLCVSAASLVVIVSINILQAKPQASSERRTTPELATGASPELFLRYEEPPPVSEFSGFYLDNQSERIAFAVEISSELKIGMDGHLIVLLWEKPSRPIEKGRKPYPIHLVTAERKKGIDYPVGGLKPDQIHIFFQRIKTKNDVIVTLTCTDVSGVPCAPRQFRVFKSDFIQGRKIYCEPLPSTIPFPRW